MQIDHIVPALLPGWAELVALYLNMCMCDKYVYRNEGTNETVTAVLCVKSKGQGHNSLDPSWSRQNSATRPAANTVTDRGLQGSSVVSDQVFFKIADHASVCKCTQHCHDQALSFKTCIC